MNQGVIANSWLANKTPNKLSFDPGYMNYLYSMLETSDPTNGHPLAIFGCIGAASMLLSAVQRNSMTLCRVSSAMRKYPRVSDPLSHRSPYARSILYLCYP